MSKILGIPNDGYDYEFMVVFPREDGDYDWYANFETVVAFEVADEVGGIVVHNVRVTHKQKKKGK